MRRRYSATAQFGLRAALLLPSLLLPTLLLPTLLLGCPGQQTTHSGPALRYRVEAVIAKDGPRLLRFDSALGRAWIAPIVGARDWQLLGPASQTVSGEATLGRFRFQVVHARSTPVTIVRSDVHSGEVWRMALPDDHNWISYREGLEPPSP
jgi:hypothetical protein